MMDGKTIAFLVAPEGVEEVELTEPWKAVKQAGGTPKLVSTDSGRIQAFNHLDKAGTYAVDATVDEVSASDFDGLVLPGGVANPDFLRMHDKAVGFVRGFFDAGNIYPLASDLDFTDLRPAAGFGGRYRSPIGPIRVDLGFNLAIAAGVLVILAGAAGLAWSLGLLTITIDVAAILDALDARETTGRVLSQVQTVAMSALLLTTALGLWWWAETASD